MAALAGGVAIIRVGATTETELKEKMALAEDALHSARAAMEEGIVPGGGVALLQAGRALDGLTLTGDEVLGSALVRRATEEPMRQIAANAGYDGTVVIGKIRQSASHNYGFNALTGKYEDMFAFGRHRSRQSDAPGPSECLVGCRADADVRSDHKRVFTEDRRRRTWIYLPRYVRSRRVPGFPGLQIDLRPEVPPTSTP